MDTAGSSGMAGKWWRGEREDSGNEISVPDPSRSDLRAPLALQWVLSIAPVPSQSPQTGTGWFWLGCCSSFIHLSS